VPGISLAKAYITVKGFSADNALDLNYPARNDSVTFCRLGHLMLAAAKDCMIAHNTINGTSWLLREPVEGFCYNKLVLDKPVHGEQRARTPCVANTINLGSVAGGEKAWDMRAWTQALSDRFRTGSRWRSTRPARAAWTRASRSGCSHTYFKHVSATTAGTMEALTRTASAANSATGRVSRARGTPTNSKHLGTRHSC
jgi:hypothetical protein